VADVDAHNVGALPREVSGVRGTLAVGGTGDERHAAFDAPAHALTHDSSHECSPT
jgi:hypothetical protein